jgi:hypothetical protein
VKKLTAFLVRVSGASSASNNGTIILATLEKPLLCRRTLEATHRTRNYLGFPGLTRELVLDLRHRPAGNRRRGLRRQPEGEEEKRVSNPQAGVKGPTHRVGPQPLYGMLCAKS